MLQLNTLIILNNNVIVKVAKGLNCKGCYFKDNIHTVCMHKEHIKLLPKYLLHKENTFSCFRTIGAGTVFRKLEGGI